MLNNINKQQQVQYCYMQHMMFQ